MDAENQKTELSGKLESLDVDELKDLRKTVDRAIASYETRKRQEAISAVEQAAREHGFKLADLLGNGKAGRGRKSEAGSTESAAKYVNPDNSEQTWSGRGRRPQWINEALESGRTLEEFAA
ncbi:H-NS family nucleoid-associated regulatory protein [Paracoccus sp. MC1862]|uniref:H-NS histone family protein n=1 Tax=Paracoccus sp. MC1862 TaxID=2760307 RepID=UPI0015FF21C6|nr:H-NS histone family protein [Paracoccus sp. MC1862]MBB1499664.1 H-NS histone family protein [Paracoccus sp. MC1862]QQO46557.1 H-NS histone family protein [Paracoccus sp. MC1862]